MAKSSYIGTAVSYVISPITALLFVFVFVFVTIPETIVRKVAWYCYRADVQAGNADYPALSLLVLLFVAIYCMCLSVMLYAAIVDVIEVA